MNITLPKTSETEGFIPDTDSKGKPFTVIGADAILVEGAAPTIRRRSFAGTVGALWWSGTVFLASSFMG